MNEASAFQIVMGVAWGGGIGLILVVIGAFFYLFWGEGRWNPSFSSEAFVARRFMMAKRNHQAISMIGFISILAVMSACAGIILVMSVMNGFSTDFRDKILGANPHVMLMKYGHDFSDYPLVLEKTKRLKGVESAQPFVLGEGMLSSQYNMTGCVLKGIADESIASHGIVIGEEMAKTLRVFEGDAIRLVSPMGELGPMGLMPKTRTFKVVRLFKTGMYEYDSKFAYIALASAQSLFGLGMGVSGVEYRIDHPDEAAWVGEEIEKAAGAYPFYVRDWMEMNRSLFSALKLEKVAMFIILMTLLAMASLLILVTLILVVLEKGKEIAILKSMGATHVSVMKIFVIYGVSIGAVGTLLGTLIGIGGCWLLQKLGIGLDAEIYYISQIPVRMNPAEVSWVVFGSLVLSFLATIPPSLMAARLKPVEGLRYE
ncbi:MAG: ABC transporter permease [Myxococcaceae bacterium]|nr:ABC transporter permease [Myxococcaceae bacterium]MBH2006773.1 ABC transporter permease [Myxococcaceae bacterium]